MSINVCLMYQYEFKNGKGFNRSMPNRIMHTFILVLFQSSIKYYKRISTRDKPDKHNTDEKVKKNKKTNNEYILIFNMIDNRP